MGRFGQNLSTSRAAALEAVVGAVATVYPVPEREALYAEKARQAREVLAPSGYDANDVALVLSDTVVDGCTAEEAARAILAAAARQARVVASIEQWRRTRNREIMAAPTYPELVAIDISVEGLRTAIERGVN